MRAGKLRHILQLMKPVPRTDTQGDAQSSGYQEDGKPVPADVQPLTGKELYLAQQVRADVTHKITIRYRAGITYHYRAVLTWRDDKGVRQSKTFELGPALSTDERRRDMTFTAIEIAKP